MVCCSICGLNTRTFSPTERGRDSPWAVELTKRTGWWADVRLLCDPDDEIGNLCPSLSYANIHADCRITLREANLSASRPRSEASDIEVHRGRNVKAGVFKRVDPDKSEHEIILTPARDQPRRTFDGRHYLPVHSVCLTMARKLFETTAEHASIRDMRSLFIALGWRYTLGFKCNGPLQEYAPNAWIGRKDFLHKWTDWKLRFLDYGKWIPARALPGDAEYPLDNIPDVSQSTQDLFAQNCLTQLALGHESTGDR